MGVWGADIKTLCSVKGKKPSTPEIFLCFASFLPAAVISAEKKHEALMGGMQIPGRCGCYLLFWQKYAACENTMMKHN